MKKAVFFDIDGTLLDAHNYIQPSAIAGIHRIQEAGNYAFICTGRTRAFVNEPNLLAIGFDGIISGCGTMIELGSEVIHYQKLENEKIWPLITFLRDQNIAVLMEGRFHMYLDEKDFIGDRYIERLKAEVGDALEPISGNEARWEASKFSCITEKADLAIVKQKLGNDYELIIHDMPVMEIVPKGCTKGTGIRKLCARLGIAPEDTFAFGDSVNDLAMFEAVGCSIAMGNSSDYVKGKASYVTDSLHDDGIYHALEHFGLFGDP